MNIKNYSRNDIKKYFGSLEQVAGIQRFTYDEGKAKGLSAAEVRTGSGLRFVVLLDRGMDIGLCEYRGKPMAFRSAAGEVSPVHYDASGDQWLRSFNGGLLTTCGLTYLGASTIDQGEKLGLHGRINNIPAEKIQIEEKWEGNECKFILKGKIREVKPLNYNVLLERKITALLGENKIRINDKVINEGFNRTPHMILYHFNIGHPFLDKGTKLVAESEKVKPRDKIAEEYFTDYDIYQEPTDNYPDVVFYHKLKTNNKGWSKVELINEKLKERIYLKYNAKNLNNFIQWKFTGKGDYVTGLEPANCLVEGRDKERERGSLINLQPGEERKYELEIGLST